MIVIERRTAPSNPVQRLQHDDRVSADHNHSNLLLLAGLLLLDGFVDDEIHEGIVTAQNPRELTPAVDLKGQFLVHELLELGRMSLRHGVEIDRRSTMNRNQLKEFKIASAN